ncbi:MAG: hypothetical protein ACKVQJ_13260 [Pyrinomonadaceae bacterium]
MADELVTLNSRPSEERVEETNLPTLSGFPKWLIAAYLILGLYVGVNFIVFGIGAEGTPERRDNSFVLTNHGQLVREISAQEYELASAHLLHGFSGHWIIFYFYIAAAAFTSAGRNKL